MQTAPYLADVNWDAVYEKKMDAGFVPNVSGNHLDHSHACTHIKPYNIVYVHC